MSFGYWYCWAKNPSQLPEPALWPGKHHSALIYVTFRASGQGASNEYKWPVAWYLAGPLQCESYSTRSLALASAFVRDGMFVGLSDPPCFSA